MRYRIVAFKFSQRYFFGGGNLYLQACKKNKTLKELSGQFSCKINYFKTKILDQILLTNVICCLLIRFASNEMKFR